MTSIADKQLTAEDIIALVTPPPAAPAPEKPKPPQLPEKLEVENYSQAKRLAVLLFGPLSRLKRITLPDGVKGIELSLPGVLSTFGKDWKDAINAGMAAVAAKPDDMDSYFGWDKAAMPDKRRELVSALRGKLAGICAASYKGDEQMKAMLGVFGLHDHQLFEVQKLLDRTTSGKMELRELAAKHLEQALDEGYKRFQKLQAKAEKN